MKKGQVTVFIILGLVILLLFLIIFSLKSEREVVDKVIIDKVTKDPIKNHIESCLFSTTEKAIYKVSSQGGYINPRGDSKYDEPGDGAFRHVYYFLNNNILPYVLDTNEIKLRSKEEIENIIANYVNIEINSCLDFLIFKNQGIEIEQTGEQTIEVIISDNSVFSTISTSLLIKKSEEISKIKKIKVEIPLRLGLLYKVSSELLQDIKTKQKINLMNKCNFYLKSIDRTNIYLESNKLTYEYAIRIVDSNPLDRGKMPLVWQIAIKNINVEGQCLG